MKKLILSDNEYAVLQRLLRAIPPAHLPRFLPDWTGVDMRDYRNILAIVLKDPDRRFPASDDTEG